MSAYRTSIVMRRAPPAAWSRRAWAWFRGVYRRERARQDRLKRRRWATQLLTTVDGLTERLVAAGHDAQEIRDMILETLLDARGE